MRDLTGILGLGISGLAAFEFLRKQNKNIVVFDDKIKPNPKKVITREDPPKDTNGNGIPTTGVKPITIAIFTAK